MTEDLYYHKILAYLEPVYYRLLFLGMIASVTFFSYEYYIQRSFNDLSYIYIILAIGLFLSFYLRKKVPIKANIIYTLIFLITCSTLAIYLKGLNNLSISIFVVSTLMGTLFLENKNSRLLIFYTIILIFVSGYFKYQGVHSENTQIMATSSFYWLRYGVGYVFLALSIILSVNGIKSYLIKLIESLNRKVSLLNQTKLELQIQNEEIKENNKIIFDLAYKDQVTRISNKNALSFIINKKISSKTPKGAFYLINIGDLKTINSILGEEAGDSFLKSIADGLVKYFKPYSIIGRSGAKEFVVFTEILDKEYFNDNIKKLKNHLLENNPYIETEYSMQTYLSSSLYPNDGESFDQLYRKALIAMEYGRKNLIDTLVSYENVFLEDLSEKENIKKEIEIGIVEEEFIVYYQEKINIKTGKVCGLEALARWDSKKLGMIGPNVFIPIIENSKLTIPFSEMIVKRVLQDFKRIKIKYGGDITVSINISPVHIIYKDFKNFLMDQCKLNNVENDKIELEITENVMIQGFEQIEKIVNDLRQQGFKVSLDDFGTGYSSLSYISKIPIDILKIDKSFIDNITGNKRAKVMIESIINIARAYSMSVVAEGVETKEQVEMLTSLGCDIVQGYYYSRPNPL
ncbi:diguanylate cyclase (GGDEF)-like protein [Acetoanaerobium pronyense]|uniref:Diguanylate cyclase (GGDEF)-like protein n=1 Tax=Acetoanaerobium pronyense TaxID=1482736 RepID=A0ABS4KM91_9FIRM|nr:GGDEF domain-containing phosphodiesterase [Acetoanaerobium pronyense]MBP2028880.1 diguanylate cyclase (GGDEF)-like protein [Acetoanaerobium pronyense]